VSAAIALGGSALVAGAGFAAVTYGGALADSTKGVASTGAAASSPKAAVVAPNVAGSGQSGVRTGDRVPPGQKKKPRPSVRPAAGADPEPDRARVSIVVNGPQNAIVSLDGVKLDDWFGPPREITVGPHVFEFQPPSPDCCEPGQKLQVEIKPPRNADDVQIVQGRIAFKNAVLELAGTPGSTASCGELGTFPVPSRQSLPMLSAQRRAQCTLLPAPGSAMPPKGFDVTLSPGGVFRFPSP